MKAYIDFFDIISIKTIDIYFIVVKLIFFIYLVISISGSENLACITYPIRRKYDYMKLEAELQGGENHGYSGSITQQSDGKSRTG